LAFAAADHAMSVTFNVDPKTPIHALVRLELLLRGESIAGWMQAVTIPFLRKRAEDRFAGEGDDVVGKWAPLKPYTILTRIQAGFGAGPINVQTGELKRFVTEGQFIIGWPADQATMRFPSAPPSGELRRKFTTAQKGRSDPRTPPRPVIGLGVKDSSEITTLLALYIQEASG
jgi:hypothetical protein